ncbi:hypothetical protein HBF32_10215 [Luteibacter yeojuensis]|uniref:Uncharacterized protein n=2 Tax=Luteibacter yeojuensis TaxID=345309 RepID=A0A7X5TQ87_9GAMM|nr:hypothetical protein [Luteibacter yeojuensis]
MAPIDQYLMADRDAEIALARSAAPASISRDATVLVLGRKGYETAAEGTNGFVCVVARSWTGPFDWPEFWNPKIRAADCLNPQAARSIVPIYKLRAGMAMAGKSKSDMLSAVRAAYARKELPALESGAMDYMMSKSSYLTDEGEHNMPHVMFDTLVKDAKDWGANMEGSPVMASPYWFMFADPSESKGLPPILVFLVGSSTWSDGTPADMHRH